MPQNQSQERRHFERIPFAHEAWIETSEGRHPCELLDISFRGALVQVGPDASPALNQAVDLRLPLTETDDLSINMHGTVVWITDRRVAMRCDQMDIDSMTLLRRLVEMNLGDASMLDREFEAIIN